MKHNRILKLLCIVSIGITAFVAILTFIPKLIMKHSSKAYKKDLDEVDYDNLGPEIIKKSEEVEDDE